MSEHRPSPFEPIKLNLVEQPGWGWGGGADDQAMDAASEDYRHMDLNTLESLIDDLWNAKDSKGRVSKRRLTSEELEFLASRLKDRDDQLEALRQPIIDAITWMYEAAAIPTDGDIEVAEEEAAGEIIKADSISSDLWEPVLNEEVKRGALDWSPRKKWTSEDILKQLMGKITFSHEKGQWERFLIYDFWEAEVSHKLFSRYKGMIHAKDRMQKEFEWLASEHTKDTLTNVAKAMRDVDISNRTDWDAAWKSMLASVEPGVRAGIREVLKEMPRG